MNYRKFAALYAIVELFFLGLLSFCVLRLCLEPETTSEFVIGVGLAVLLNIYCAFSMMLLLGLVDKNQQILQAYIFHTYIWSILHSALFLVFLSMHSSFPFNTFGFTEIHMFWGSIWQLLFHIHILGTFLTVLDVSFFPVCVIYLHCVRTLVRKAQNEINQDGQKEMVV